MAASGSGRNAGRGSAGRLGGAVVLLVLGIALVVLYFSHVGRLGEPTDIGGGLVALAGWILTGVGVSLIGMHLLRQRGGRGGDDSDKPTVR